MSAEVLISGFEPFGGDERNPSWEACAALDGREFKGSRVRAICLPTAFSVAARKMLQQIARNTTRLVIATGVAAGRCEITPERFALNFADARIADNRGEQPQERTLIKDAPLAYASTLPITRIINALRAHGIPAAPSLSAGAYVCNELFFRLRHALEGQDIAVGFIHLPYASEQVCDRPGVPGLPLATITEGLRVAIEVSLSTLSSESQRT